MEADAQLASNDAQLASNDVESNKWQEINYPELGIKIHATLNMPEQRIVDNIRTNVQRNLPQVWPHQPQDTTIALIAGGPSLETTLDEIREVQEDGAKVVALANTAKYLLKNRIRPNAHVLLDAREGNRSFIEPELDCTYFIASQCDPDLFEQVKDKKVYIWHAVNSTDEMEAIKDFQEMWVPIQGGNTIALRALRMLQILGYHRFELFGFDSCNDGKRHHAYDQPAHDDVETKTIALNGRPFTVTAWQIQQAMEFMKMVKAFGDKWEVRAHGDGLIQHMIREGGKNGSDSMGIL